MGLLNPGGPIAQSQRNRCSIPPVEVISPSGVRNFIGLGLSQVYELIKRIDFPAFRVGNRIFIPRDKFLAWIDTQTEEKESLFYVG